MLSVDVDRAAIARYGLTVADLHTVAAGVGGRHAGQLFRATAASTSSAARSGAPDPDARRLPVLLSHEDTPAARVGARRRRSGRAPLHPYRSGRWRRCGSSGPNQISRENGKRRVVVQANVRGRDLGSFVADAQARFAAEVRLPPGTWLEWGGQFESLLDARQRLMLVVPLCFLIILLLLYATLGSFADALIIFSSVPLALSGGVATLWLRGMPFSITAAVGFIALSGVAVLNGLVLLSFIRDLRHDGAALDDAITRGAITRLRPVLMTALVASLGFLPMALATGTGAEVQRPLATVVIGGLMTSTALTLIVLPALYRIVRGHR